MRSITPPVITAVFVAIGVLMYVSLFAIEPSELTEEQLDVVASTIRSLVYGFVATSVAITVWTLTTMKTSSKTHKFLELFTVIVLMLTSVAVFGLVYRTSGLLLDGHLVHPNAQDALLFSTSVFTSNGFTSGLSPANSDKILVALQEMIGFIMVPVLIALALQFISAPFQEDK